MIEEKFLKTAVEIRKSYLKLLTEVKTYENDARKVSERLQEIVTQLEDVEKDAKENTKRKDNLKKDTKQYMVELLKIIDDIEVEGKRIENLLKPLNKGIEKLSSEEVELYNQIKEKYVNLTDDEIVNCVQDRLIRENLN